MSLTTRKTLIAAAFVALAGSTLSAAPGHAADASSGDGATLSTTAAPAKAAAGQDARSWR